MSTFRVLARSALLAVSLIAMLPAASPAAASLDGSVPILCAPTDVMECTADGQCARRGLEGVNLPRFIAVDVNAKSLSSVDGERSAPIHRIEQVTSGLILQGGQEGRAWSMTIGPSGKLTAGILMDDETAVVIFGACTPR